jgi:hypothetical protein
LQVLSEHWPVLDGDELVSPTRAMNEASAVVAQYQVAKITNNRLNVDHLHHETAMALTLYGIYGLSEFPFDDALNLSRSLNISLEMKSGGYTVSDRMIGINLETSSSRARHHKADHLGYPAPLLRRGSKLRLTLPEERDMDRVERPQTEWDILHGLILKYREGDVPVARAYLTQHAGEKEQVIYDLLEVWASEMPDESLRKEAELLRYGLKG